MSHLPTVIVHGGAGLIQRGALTPERERVCRDGMEQALRAGIDAIEAGGTALDAVEQAVCVLEAHEAFNAGRGAVLNIDGELELDASIMDSLGQRAGAVSGVRRLAHPIRVARALLEEGVHVAQAGVGAEHFAASIGIPLCAPLDLLTDERRAQWQRLRGTALSLDHGGAGGVSNDPQKDVYGTVGAVAIDATGRLAAATSTGGMVNKRRGRVSDTAIIGAGTWAREGVCAVSCTGHGEYFVRVGVAHRIAALIEFSGLSLAKATERVLGEVEAMGGTGGVIAIDAAGAIATPFCSAGMFHGVIRRGETPRTGIWEPA